LGLISFVVAVTRHALFILVECAVLVFVFAVLTEAWFSDQLGWSVCDSVCDILRGLFGALFLFFSQYKYSLYRLLLNIMSMENDKYQEQYQENDNIMFMELLKVEIKFNG
jgi:hypothetical protein